LGIVFVVCDNNSVVVDFEACSVCWLGSSDESELIVILSDLIATVVWDFVSVDGFAVSVLWS
jgi:hypothetical protein